MLLSTLEAAACGDNNSLRATTCDDNGSLRATGCNNASFVTATENGAPAVPFDEWKGFVDLVASPVEEWIAHARETRRDETARCFDKLYDKDPKRASLICMAFQNLRKGGGGLTNKDAFFACLDVLWRRDPMFIVRNVEVMAENGSYNLVNEILLHVSNADVKKQVTGPETEYVYTETVRSPWNYWGLELDVFPNREEHRMSYRPEEARQYLASLECWMCFQRKQAADKEQKAVDNQQLRRLQKCERRLNVFREFLWWMRNGKKQPPLEQHLPEVQVIRLDDVMTELLAEKPNLRQKMYIVYDTARVPKNGAIAELFEKYIPIYEADPPCEHEYEPPEFGQLYDDCEDDCGESLGTRVSSNAMIGRSLAGVMTRPGERKLAEQVAALEALCSRSEEQEQQLEELRWNLEYVRVRNTKPDLDTIRTLIKEDPRWQKLYDQARALHCDW